MNEARRWAMMLGGLLVAGLAGCEDKELESKSAAQKARIAELEMQVESLKTELGDGPSGNPAAELESAEKDLEAAKSKVEGLQSEIDKLGAEREQIAKDFADYKRKYSIDE